MTSDDTPDDDGGLAAEYALGLLTGDDLAEAERLLATDRDFAQSVAYWEMQFATLTDDLVEEAPSSSVKNQLLAQISPTTERTSWWGGLRVWQAVGGVSLIILTTVITLDLSMSVNETGPLYTAEIVADTGDFRVVAVVDKSINEVFLTITTGGARESRILQVWAHGEGQPPTSVGLWPEGEAIRLQLPQTIAAVEGILTLGISEEPPDGSPTGQPSGRIFGTVDIPVTSGRL